MIEVFKTNVTNHDQGTEIIDHIHQGFAAHKANFDLDDCDHILRVECITGDLQTTGIISLLSNLGFYAEVLSNDYPQTLDVELKNYLLNTIRA